MPDTKDKSWVNRERSPEHPFKSYSDRSSVDLATKVTRVDRILPTEFILLGFAGAHLGSTPAGPPAIVAPMTE